MGKGRGRGRGVTKGGQCVLRGVQVLQLLQLLAVALTLDPIDSFCRSVMPYSLGTTAAARTLDKL